MKTKLNKLISETISGEWGEEDIRFQNVNIIRAANFNNDGTIDFSKLVERAILKDLKEGGIVKRIVDEKKIESKKLIDDDIIIEKSGGGPQTPVGRIVYFINPDNKIYLCNNFTQIIRVDKNKIHPKYFFYGLQHLYDTRRVLKYQNQTTGLINLKLERYLQEEIEVPNLDIQLKIYTQLEIIQKLIDDRKKSILILENLQRSEFFNLFGDPVKNSKKFKTISLSNSIFKISSGFTPNRNNSEYFNGNILWAKSTDVKGGVIESTEETISEKAISETGAKVFLKGSVLIAMYGQGKTRGRVALLGANSACNQACAVVNSTKFSNKFLFSLFNYSYDYLRSLSKGGNRDNLSLTILKRVKIINPIIELQIKYEKLFDEIYKQKQELQQSLGLLEKLFQSVLHNSFNKNIQINETPIFNELIKEFGVDDLKGNNDRLQNLINLFDDNKFNDIESYNDARNKLFELMDEGVITQKFKNDKIELQIK